MDYLKIYRDKRSLYSLNNVELIYILFTKNQTRSKFWSLYLKIIYSKACISMNFSHMYQCAYSSIHSPNQNNQHSLHPKCTYAPVSQSNHYIYVYIKQWKHIRVLAICVLREILPCIFCSPLKRTKFYFKVLQHIYWVTTTCQPFFWALGAQHHSVAGFCSPGTCILGGRK